MMIELTMVDGSKRSCEAGATGLDVAASIAPSLAKRSVAYLADGVLTDLLAPMQHSCRFELIDRNHERALELIRHDCAHILAEAVQSLYPSIRVTIGPVIENGFYYDFYCPDGPLTDDDLPQIESRMRKIIARNDAFECEVWDRERAITTFEDMGENFKVELIESIPADQALTIYRQGEWFDLCRGPHMRRTGLVGDAFKLTHASGSYWRGRADGTRLTRIYGVAFAAKNELDAYLHRMAEAEKRDHRKIGKQIDFFHFDSNAPGSVYWHPNGWIAFRELVEYIRRRQTAYGFSEVNSPDMMDRDLWEISGHWEKYRENMFVAEVDNDRIFALKPMNCPGHVQIYSNRLHSYRDLPVRYAEFGKVHRNEHSGALHGLLRVRSFTQDDAHVFLTREQVTEECLGLNDLILSIYRDFGFSDVRIEFSDRPAVRVGSDEVWDQAEAALRNVIETSGNDYRLNPGDGAFYGPKLDYVLRDAIGREWQCGTIQADFNLPDRFGITYIDRDNSKQVPIMLHRAMLGSIERFLGILIENCEGNLPLWLAPTQVAIANITEASSSYATQIEQTCRRAGLRTKLDLRNEKISYKIREHSLAKVPLVFSVGEREAAQGDVNVRRLGSREQENFSQDAAISAAVAEAMPPDLR